MAENDYVYAVARIRAQEMKLLSASFLEQMIPLPDEEACLRLLAEKGWGSPGQDAGAMLSEEHKKTWDLMAELTGRHMEIFDVFRLENDYHNLKAAVKSTCSDQQIEGIYVEAGTVPLERIRAAASGNDFSGLPGRMASAGEEAMDTLLKTGDGQVCDCILDRAALEDICEAGRKSGEKILEEYGEMRCASGDIRIAVRCARTGKDRTFLERAVADCRSLSRQQLIDAAAAGVEAICTYLSHTDYADAAAELEKSMSAFEKWCDDSLIRRVRPELYDSFGPGPLAAYILARESEIRSVRIILSGKRNAMPEQAIRERVRETYV